MSSNHSIDVLPVIEEEYDKPKVSPEKPTKSVDIKQQGKTVLSTISRILCFSACCTQNSTISMQNPEPKENP